MLTRPLTPGRLLTWRRCRLGLHGGAFCAASLQKCYRGELEIQICQSSQRLQVPLLGRGLEPRLEFSPEELKLGPLLPQSGGEEGTVVVKNPCEAYSLEFDQQHLAEEQVRGKVCAHSCRLPALQHSQACAREMGAVRRAKPGGIPGLASSAGRLRRDLDNPCHWGEGVWEGMAWLGSLFTWRRSRNSSCLWFLFPLCTAATDTER